jgi:DnaJ-class molecular chaperone
MHDELDQEYEERSTNALSHLHFPLDCAFCRGTGVNPSTMNLINHQQCPVCKGKGISDIRLDRDNCKPCLHCVSSGRESDSLPLKPCIVCGGKGVL